jgi:type IV pilus assembly protein PilB
MEDARASESVHSAVEASQTAEVEEEMRPGDESLREDSVVPHHQQPSAMSEDELAGPRSESINRSDSPRSRRLNWLVDYMDDGEEHGASSDRGSEIESPVAPSAPLDTRSPYATHSDEGSESWRGIEETSQGTDSQTDREPDFYRDSILEDDHYPLRPIETIGEVDAISPLRSVSLSGDGFRESSVPEARHSELPPPSLSSPELEQDDEDPLDVAPEAGSRDGEPVAETKSEPALPDAPVDDVLIEQIKRKDRVVAMLLRQEIVTPQQVANAQQKREHSGKKETLWRVLATLNTVDAEAVYREAARVYAFRTITVDDGGPDVEFARSVIETFPEDQRDRLIKLRVLPLAAEMEKKTGAIKLIFATHDPTRPEMHKVMQDLRLERFELRYAPESFVKAFIQEAFPKKNEFLERMTEGSMRYDLGASFDDKSTLIDEEALEAEISRSSLINLFEATLVEAVRRGASDIHIYPNAEKHIEVHFRVDGRLGHWHTEQKVHPEALLAVIKDNAMNVDRFERDSAQDGFIQRWIDDALIRFRVSVLPIANAVQEMRSESIVIRVLDDRKVITDLKTLGLLDTALERFEMAIRQPHGMVILTGPTGSGKSTTLVAAMHQVVTPEVNVLTVEDPVEYIIPGVRQIKLNHKLGLEEALRAILRHDPDVVMVGEMRDRQTADLAIKLANTGHLTFSTLHTNDAPSAVSRLFKMGIEPFLIAYAINMVVAQRLIRTLCKECKVVDNDPDTVMLKKLGFTDEDIGTTTIYKTGNNPKCKSCKGTSYKGRRAVTEALYFSRPIRHLIVEAQNMIDEEAIRQQAVKEGMLTLKDSAREIVKMGETSITEMIRVVTTDH